MPSLLPSTATSSRRRRQCYYFWTSFGKLFLALVLSFAILRRYTNSPSSSPWSNPTLYIYNDNANTTTTSDNQVTAPPAASGGDGRGVGAGDGGDDALHTTITTTTTTAANSQTNNRHVVKIITDTIMIAQKEITIQFAADQFTRSPPNLATTPARLTSKATTSTAIATAASATTTSSTTLKSTPPPPPPSFRLFIGIFSMEKDLEARQSIRDTWGNHLDNTIVFLIAGDSRIVDTTTTRNDGAAGESESTTTSRIQEEMMKYGDIFYISGYGKETYRMLMYKTYAFLAVVNKYTTTASAVSSSSNDKVVEFDYAIKTDDDVYLNINHWYSVIQSLHQRSQSESLSIDYIGHCKYNLTIDGVFRDPKHKWYVTPEEMPVSRTYFPDFAIGGAFALSAKFLQSPCLYNYITTDLSGFLPLEDVAVGEIAKYCDVPCTYAQLLDPVTRQNTRELSAVHEFYDITDTYSNQHTLALFDIKKPEFMYRVHVERCIQHPNDITCRNFNTTCGRTTTQVVQDGNTNVTTLSISTLPCIKEYLHCGVGPDRIAKRCIHCAKKRGRMHPEWCHGDCHWCEFGTTTTNSTAKKKGDAGDCVQNTMKCNDNKPQV